MTKEETELIIKEQDKNTKEILKAIEKEKCELLGIIQGKDKAIKDLEKQLTKVKELLKKVIKVTWGEGWNYSLGVKVEAENFLKENK